MTQVTHPEFSRPRGAAADSRCRGTRRTLMGRWADVRRPRGPTARPEFQRIAGQSMAEHRERVLSQLHLLVARARCTARSPSASAATTTTAATSPVRGARRRRPDPADQVRRAVGPVRLRDAAPRHGAAPRQVAARHDEPRDPRRVRDDRDRPRLGCRGHRHDRDLRRDHRRVRHPHAVPRGVEGLPRQRRHARHRRRRVRAAHHQRRQPRRARFYVPIRDDDGDFLPGIGGEDDGLKGGLNGIDNGRLHFTTCASRAPTCSTATATSPSDGTYSSAIDSPGRRFFTMLGTLVQGRVSLDGAAAVASKLALTIAITYANQRRQFAGRATRRVVLLDYQRHQRRLLPRSPRPTRRPSRTTSFLRSSTPSSAARTTPARPRGPRDPRRRAQAAATWHALDTLQEAREACGGAGFLAENRFVRLRADLDVYATFEGDNNVLLQLVGKRLLTDYAAVQGRGCRGARPVRRRPGGEAAFHRAGLRQLGQTVTDFGSTARSVGYVRDADPQRELLTDRVQTMVAEIAGACDRAPSCPRPRPPRCSTPTRTSSSRPPARTASCCSGRRSPTRSTSSTTPARSTCSPGCATCSASASSRSTSPGTSSTAGSRRSAQPRSPPTSTACCLRLCAARAGPRRRVRLRARARRAPIAPGAEPSGRTRRAPTTPSTAPPAPTDRREDAQGACEALEVARSTAKHRGSSEAQRIERSLADRARRDLTDGQLS